MEKLVSIIVPIYNAEHYLVQCLDSIINQTYRNLEIILIDDGSIDNSLSICNLYASIDERIIVVHKENGGVSSARNHGIIKSKGYYILFVDSDDTIERTYVEDLVIVNEDDSYDLIICGFKEVYTYKNLSRINLISENLSGNIKDDYYKLNDFCKSPYVKLYKAEIIRNKNILFPLTIRIGEDQVFNHLYLHYVTKYNFVNKSLYNYYIRESFSLSKACSKKDFNDTIHRLEIEKNFLYTHRISKAELILSKHIISIIAHFTILENEDDGYNGFKKRLEMLVNSVDIKLTDLSWKRQIIVFFIRNNIYSIVYLLMLLRRGLYKLKNHF